MFVIYGYIIMPLVTTLNCHPFVKAKNEWDANDKGHYSYE